MPDPALSSGIKCLISGIPDTKEEHCSISQNQIMRPPGHAPCGRVYFKDREKLNVSFLRSFFALIESAVSFFWLYRKVKKGKLYGRSKNQNLVRRTGSLDGGYAKASHWLEDGMNIAQISFLLGHSQLETTMIYLDITTEQETAALATLEDESDRNAVPKWNPNSDSLSAICGLRKLQ